MIQGYPLRDTEVDMIGKKYCIWYSTILQLTFLISVHVEFIHRGILHCCGYTLMHN